MQLAHGVAGDELEATAERVAVILEDCPELGLKFCTKLLMQISPVSSSVEQASEVTSAINLDQDSLGFLKPFGNLKVMQLITNLP